MRFAVFWCIVPRKGVEESAFSWDGMGVSSVVDVDCSPSAARWHGELRI